MIVYPQIVNLEEDTRFQLVINTIRSPHFVFLLMLTKQLRIMYEILVFYSGFDFCMD